MVEEFYKKRIIKLKLVNNSRATAEYTTVTLRLHKLNFEASVRLKQCLSMGDVAVWGCGSQP